MERSRFLLRPERNFLVALFLFALGLRLAYVLPLPADKLSPDAFDWLTTGWAIAQGLGFGGSWRPPGHAFFLAGIFFVFGRSVLAARVIQALLGALTCLLTWKTGKMIFDEGTGRIAGVLAGFYPYFIAYTGDLLSETLLTFMLALAVYRTVRTAESPSWKNIAFAGVCIGLTGLTKSVVLPFFVLACAWLWWQTGKFRVGFMVGVFTLLTIAPWTLRNYYHYDKAYVMPVSTPWFSLYGSSHDGALLMEMKPEVDSPQPDADNGAAIPSDWKELSEMPLPQRDKICREKALNWIKANPDKFTWLLRRRFLHFWRLYPLMAYKWQKYAAMATSGLYIPLAFIGLLLSLRSFSKPVLLAALLGTYTLVHLFFVVTLRYRIPADPYILIFASYALSRAAQKCRAQWAHGKDDK